MHIQLTSAGRTEMGTSWSIDPFYDSQNFLFPDCSYTIQTAKQQQYDFLPGCVAE